MADELTEALIRGVQHGQQQAYNEERTKIGHETQNRLVEAMALRAQQADAKRPRQIPQQLLASLLNPDATSDEIAGAYGMAASYDIDLANKAAAMGATARQKLAAEKASQLSEEELRVMSESNPEAARGLSAGMPRQTALSVYGEANRNQRDKTFKPDAPKGTAAKPPPPYFDKYVTKESEVPGAIENELSQRLYQMPSDALADLEKVEDGPAKGMSGKEVRRHLLGLAMEAQALARKGTPLVDAIEQVAARGLPTPGRNRWGPLPDVKPTFNGGTKPPPVAAAAAPNPLDAIIEKAGGDRAKIRDLIRASGITYTPEDIAYIKSKLGG